MLQGGGGQYKGGFGGLTKVMVREFEKNGGTLIKNCKADKINIEDGIVSGVTTPKGTFNAPVIVSSAGIQPTILKLCGEEHFDKTYVNYIKGLVPGDPYLSATQAARMLGVSRSVADRALSSLAKSSASNSR